MGGCGPELVVNVHEDGTTGGHVSASAFLQSMINMGAGKRGAATAASQLLG